MKKLLAVVMIAVLYMNITSCATIVGGQVSSYQRTKPKEGEPQRQVKIGALICDVFFWGGAGLVVDFATGAIYKNQETKK